jgi:hypothetical protein
MSRVRLTNVWDRWRRIRRNEFLRFGMKPENANLISRGEAAARERISPVIGHKAAAGAKLEFVPDMYGQEKFVFAIDPEMVPLSKREAAAKELGVNRIATFR